MIDDRAESFEVIWHPRVIDIFFGELVGRPFLFAIECRDVEGVDRMAVIGGILAIDYPVMAVDSHGLMTMGHGEGEELPVQLLLTLGKSKNLDDASHSKRDAVRILPVCDVERRRAAFHFGGEEREVHVEGGHEVRRPRQLANPRLKLAQLLFCECRSVELYGIVRLRTRFGHRYGIFPAFIDKFDEFFELLSTEVGKCFS